MAYRVPVLNKFSWQEPVAAIANEPTVSTKGTRYIIGDTPAGDFAGITSGRLVWFDGAQWVTDQPAEGWRVFNKADGVFYTYSNNVWSSSTTLNNLKITGDIDSTGNDVVWTLNDNSASALSFDAAGKPGILKIVTTDDAEKVTMSGGLDVAGNATIAGNLTVQGAVTYLQTTNTDIKDKIVTLNKGGAVDSANGAGVEFEENGVITGYVKVSTDRTGYIFEAPANDNVLTVKATAATALLQMGGDLVVEAASAINQDVTTDSTPTFAGVAVTGNATVGGTFGVTGTSTLADVVAQAVQAASAAITGNATIGGTLAVTGTSTLADVVAQAVQAASAAITGNATIGGTLAVTGNATFSSNLTDGTNSITVANMKTAYDSRAKYDSTLGCVVFDDALLDVIA